MPKVEIEESELQALQRIHGVADAMLKNPKTRTAFLKLQKTINPDAVIPEVDAADHVMESVKGVQEKLDAVMAKMDERETKRAEDDRTAELRIRVAAGQKLVTDAGYGAEGLAKIEKLMLDEGIASYAAGLALFERLNPPPSPADQSRSRAAFGPTDHDIRSENYKDLLESHGDSDNWLQQQIADIRQEFRH